MPEIHLFSGLGSSLYDPFTLGVRKLAKRIDGLSDNANPKTHIWSEWKSVEIDILRKKRLNQLNGSVILIGHSQGVYSCMKLAKSLHDKGVSIDYIASVDATLWPINKALGNIKAVHEFKASKGFMPFFRWVAFGFLGCIKFKGFNGKHEIINVPDGHVGCIDNPKTKVKIIEHIKRLIK